MKNFLDLQATKHTVNVGLIIDREASAAPPDVVLRCNKFGWQGELGKQRVFSWEIDLLEPIVLEIMLHKKSYNQNPQTAIHLLSVRFDDFELLPNHTHHASYDNDHGWDEPTNYLGFNGIWRLQTQEPFYTWYHRISGQGWLLKP
jgi:hypothetical protein